MQGLPVILIFDVGKTNKKILLFDENYRVVWEESVQLTESADDDGFPCEDIHALTNWVTHSIERLMQSPDFSIRAINFSAYGASLVYLDESGKSILPLYNYLKPYPEQLLEKFYHAYEGKEKFSSRTASPVMGSLNSGMQLYRVKHEKPETFQKIKYALHLPQYLSYIVTKSPCSEITSIGCHTNLWDFASEDYHPWTIHEGLRIKFPPTRNSSESFSLDIKGKSISVGPGLHDSSSALIPYLSAFREPFLLLSTGTWCISLNPFNHSPLTMEELNQDCLCYLSYQNEPVKASRLFAGYEHEQRVKRLSEHFNLSTEYFSQLKFNPLHHRSTSSGELNQFENAEVAYAALIDDLIEKQVTATNLVMRGTSVRKIFVDGGFGRNDVFMNRMAACFPKIEVSAASVSQASALGAALVIYHSWNNKPISSDIIELKKYK